MFFKKLPDAVSKVANEFGFPFFDFTDIACVGSNDLEALDGLHGSEKTYARIILAICEQDEMGSR